MLRRSKTIILFTIVFCMMFSTSAFAVSSVEKEVADSIINGNSLTAETVPQIPIGDKANAYLINENKYYSNFFTAEAVSHWYKISISNSGKIDILLKVPQNTAIDYDLHLFTPQGEQFDSIENGGINEEIFKLIQPGDYYIQVESCIGFDQNTPYNLLFTYTQATDQNESGGDDSFVGAMKAGIKTTTFNTSGTIDNVFDKDFTAFDVDRTGAVAFKISEPASCNYVVDIYRLDDKLTFLGTILDQTSSQNFNFTSTGLYFACARSKTGFNPSASYTLTAHTIKWKEIILYV